MVLSNLSNNMDVESRTMVTMGDTLGALGLGKPHGVRVGCGGGGGNPAFIVAWCAPSPQPPGDFWMPPISATSWPSLASVYTPAKPQNWS